jgi:hypothetical protein
MSSLSRRRLLHLGASAGAATLAGCSILGNDDVSDVTGTIFNSDTVERTAVVTLETPDGTVAFEEEYTVPSQESVQFEYGKPADEYTLTTTSAGVAERIEWDVTVCQSWVEIGLRKDQTIDYGFSAC